MQQITLPTHRAHARYRSGWGKLLAVCAAWLLLTPLAQAQRRMEKLNRSAVAIRTSASTVFVGWRLLGTDPAGLAFNVYRGNTRVNAAPITGATNLVDNATTDAAYTVRPVLNGAEQPASAAATVWTDKYLRIPIQQPAGGTTPAGEAYTYSANDASVGDVDGDGEYEIILIKCMTSPASWWSKATPTTTFRPANTCAPACIWCACRRPANYG